jgi:hypothetical protein
LPDGKVSIAHADGRAGAQLKLRQGAKKEVLNDR